MSAITDDEAFVLPGAPVKRPTNLTLRRMVRDVCCCFPNKFGFSLPVYDRSDKEID